MKSNIAEREYYLDWLRVLAMMTIFMFHCARYFDTYPWHVKNIEQSFGMMVFVGIISQFIMPLFFTLSALSIHHSLNKRKPLQYLGERFKRLIIPLVFGALFVIAPLQVWIEQVSHNAFTGSFFDFYMHEYFNGFYGFGGNFAWSGIHLWYLEFLFLFSLMTLPLFLFLRGPLGSRQTNRLARAVEKPIIIFLLAIPIVIIELLVNLQPDGIGNRDAGGWSMLTYLIIFILGIVIATHRSFLNKIMEVRYIALILGIVFMGGVITCYQIKSESTLFYIVKFTAIAFNVWFWIIAILGFGKHYLNFNNQFLQYANRAVLPFYILHQTFIVGIGYVMIDWKSGVLIKYAVLSLSSFVLIMITYDFIIKRVKVLRFLFGMKA